VARDAAVVLGAVGGAATCASGAITAYTAEMLMAGSGVRAEVASNRRYAQAK